MNQNGKNNYVPRKGDIVTIDFNPSKGKEIRKRRPALVISNQKYSILTGLVLVCPITSSVTNRFVRMGICVSVETETISGFVNALQFHTYDYRKRNAMHIGKVDQHVLDKVLLMVNDIVNAEEK